MFTRFLPFWIFMVFFKFGGALHYTLLAPFGERFMPLWVVGLVIGASSVVQLLLDVPAGHIMDKYGYRRFLVLTTFIFLVATICYAFGLTETTYIISVIASTFGWLFFGPGTNAYTLSHSSNATAGRFMSLKDVSGSLGVVLASTALPLMLLIAPSYVGYILTLLLVVSLIAMWLAPRDIHKAPGAGKLPAEHFYIRRHFLPSMIRIMKKLNPASTMLLIYNLAGAIFYSAVWFVVPLVVASEIQSGVLGLGLGVFDLSIIVLGFALGNLADRANKRLLVFAGLLIFSVAAALTGFNLTWLFLIFGFIATTGDELTSLSLWAWLHALDKDHANDGAVSGVINLFSDLGWAIGPIVSGFVYLLIGPTWTIVLSAVPIFIVWVIYQFMTKGHPHARTLGMPRKPHRARHRT